MTSWAEEWSDNEKSGGLDFQIVPWNETPEDLEGDPDFVINHYRVDENGKRVDPKQCEARYELG